MWFRSYVNGLVVFPAFFNLSLNLAIRNSWSEPSLLFTWGQAMLEIMKTIETSFKRSHAGTATLSAPNPVAGHCQPMVTPLVTPRYSQVSLGLFLVGSLFLSPESWCSQVSICALQMFVSPVLCKFWRLYGGVNGNLLQEGYVIPRSTAPRAPAPAAVHCWPVPPQEILKHSSGSVSVGSQGPGAHKVCLSPPSISGRYAVWF